MKAFNIDPRAKVYVYDKPVSMAYGFPRLMDLRIFGPKDNHDLYVFINKKANYLKILYHHKGGWCIFAKKLDKGNFDKHTGWISLEKMTCLVNDIIVHGNKKIRKSLRAA